MNGILSVARAHVATTLRERITLFWFLAFPLFLLTLLTLIFGGAGDTGNLNFEVSLVDLDRSPPQGADFGAAVSETFQTLATRRDEGQVSLFTLHVSANDADRAQFLAEELDALRIGGRAAVVELPPGFSASVLAAATSPGSGPAAVVVHTSAGRTSSDMAYSVIEQVFASIDREVLTRLGQFNPAEAIVVGRRDVGSDVAGLGYVDFLLPGIVLMGFFVAGLFSVPGTILFGRERKVLRRYWVTPLDVPRYLAGFSLGHLALCAMQLVLVWLLGRYAFGARVALFRPLPLAYLLFAATTFLAFGFLVASLARTPNSGMAIANILNMPMMFLGGLFFPIGELPTAMRVVMMINPVTYLAEGLRATLGVGSGAFPTAASVGVPAAWIAACVVVALFRMRWDVER